MGQALKRWVWAGLRTLRSGLRSGWAWALTIPIDGSSPKKSIPGWAWALIHYFHSLGHKFSTFGTKINLYKLYLI